ncbi:thrombospondin type 3 repeat-containing protein [Candidatus Woesearchaeota archaeon]|nr:thrombospondin type 3 repeat-containing protein [Candidatus Woesearchaeota archaeon]
MKKSVIIILLALVLFSALVYAADLRTLSCSDYCKNSVYYHDGYFSVRAGKCDYQTTDCRYGCADDVCASAPERQVTTTEPQVPEPTGPPPTLTEKCPDFCKYDLYYYGGSYSPFIKQCAYAYTAKCSAGCNTAGTACATEREEPDTDNDGIPDSRDPCPKDFTNDRDGDGTCEDIDNCPGIINPGQLDSDNDGEGDLCDCNDTIQSTNEDGIDCGGQCPPCDLCTAKVLPSKFDWRNRDGQNWVSSVKNQAMCGSCWAFATLGAIEARHNIEQGKPVNIDLSEQNLVSDCGHEGTCFGGFAGHAYDFVQNQGIVSEACYPYKSQKCIYKNVRYQGGSEYLCEEKCKYENTCSYPGSCYLCDDFKDRLWYIQTYGHVANDIPTIKRAIVCKGPLTAGSKNWKHVVMFIGWDDSKQSWIVKNSWGTGWGNKGFGYIPYSGHDYSDLKNELYWPWGVYSPGQDKMSEYRSVNGFDIK